MNREVEQQPSSIMACPASPPPDAVWTMERILNDPPAAPRKRRALPKPRPLQTFSDVPPSVLLAWPLDDGGANDHDQYEGHCESLMLISSSSSSSSTLSWDATSNGLRTRVTHHRNGPPRSSSSRVFAPAPRKLFHNNHESSPASLDARLPIRSARPLGRSHSEQPMIHLHPTDDDDDEDRQGSTRHLLDHLDRPSPPASPRI